MRLCWHISKHILSNWRIILKSFWKIFALTEGDGEGEGGVVQHFLGPSLWSYCALYITFFFMFKGNLWSKKKLSSNERAWKMQNHKPSPTSMRQMVLEIFHFKVMNLSNMNVAILEIFSLFFNKVWRHRRNAARYWKNKSAIPHRSFVWFVWNFASC